MVIEEMYRNGEAPRKIAERIGTTENTIYRELRRGRTGKLDEGQKLEYSAKVAQQGRRYHFRNDG